MQYNEIISKRIFPFQTMTKDITIENSEYQMFLPVAGTLNSTIEFQVPSQVSTECMYDLTRSYILTTPTILIDGAKYTNLDKEVSLKTNFGHTLWSNFQTFINGEEVSDKHQQQYPITAFYKQLLTKKAPHGSGGMSRYSWVKMTVLLAFDGAATNFTSPKSTWSSEGEGFILCDPLENENQCIIDSSKHMWFNDQAVDPIHWAGYNTVCNNQALALRMLFSGDSNLDVVTRPLDAVWSQPHFIPSDCDLRIVLDKSPDNLCLKSQLTLNNNVKAIPSIDWSNTPCKFFLRKVYPSKDAFSAFQVARNEIKQLKYPVRRCRFDSRSLGSVAVGNINQIGLLKGPRPDLVLVAFVATQALNEGELRTSPFATSAQWDNVSGNVNYPQVATYRPPEISSIYINVGGTQYPRQNQFENLTMTNALRPYIEYMNENPAGSFGDESPCLSYQQFLSNYTFYVFNTKRNGEPIYEGPSVESENENAMIDVQAVCKTASLGAVTMVVLSYHHCHFEIGVDGTVSKFRY